MKIQTFTNQLASLTWKCRYRGFLDSGASSSLLRSEQLLSPRSLEKDGIIKGSPRQELSSHKASPPRIVALKVPTSTETGGKAQEALSQVDQREEAIQTDIKSKKGEAEPHKENIRVEDEE